MLKQSLRFLCFLLVLLLATPLLAEPSEASREEAQRYYRQADTDYKLQKYQEALDNFQKSYELSKEPSILFNIGQCYRQLKQPLEAKRSFQAFLRDAPEHPKTASAEKLIKELDAELAKLSSKGAIQISSKQDPAEVFLNGESRGSTPLLLSQIDPGDYRITLRKEGFSDIEMTVVVKPSEVSSLKDMQLAPIGEKVVVKVSPLPERRFLLSSAALAGGGLLSLGTSIFFVNRANNIQSDGVVPCDDDDLDLCRRDENQKIEKNQSTAVFAGRASSALFIGAVIPLGVGLFVKKKAPTEKP